MSNNRHLQLFVFKLEIYIMSNLIPESKEMMVLILSQLILAISAYFFFDSMHQAPAVVVKQNRTPH